MNVIDGILSTLKDLAKRINRLETQGQPTWVYLTAPLTSVDWDGDAHSTTAKTLIDLSVIFGAPAGIKAILVHAVASDSGSVGAETYFGISPNDTAGSSALVCYLTGQVNDWGVVDTGVCPCDSNGDIYYQIVASGANTLDATLRIWGYMI